MQVFHDAALDGPTNMARDEALLYSDEARPGALRIYGWTPATLSLGYFQRFEEIARLPDEIRAAPVVRRTTGGGAILHDREVTYCLTLDDSVPLARKAPAALYELAHACWRNALAPDGRATTFAPEDAPFPSPRSGPFFCFEKPGRTDLLFAGGKLLGSAQRRAPGRVLQHGSLILARRFAAHPGADLGDPPDAVVATWIQRFIAGLSEALGLTPRKAEWSRALLADAGLRRERYASEAWTRRR